MYSHLYQQDMQQIGDGKEEGGRGQRIIHTYSRFVRPSSPQPFEAVFVIEPTKISRIYVFLFHAMGGMVDIG